MDVRSKQPIREYLQKEDVQERILQYVQKGRDEATVTISRASELFGLTENKLRDWEEYGFLNPLRPSGPKGRRLYTPSELDKLAIIRELINAGYAASDIPPDIDKLWHTIRSPKDLATFPEQIEALSIPNDQFELPIDARVSQAKDDIFWRYFASHALRLSLALICEDHPNTAAGLILSFKPNFSSKAIQRIEDLSTLGLSLVGWLSQGHSSHTLLTSRPSFQYSSDFRIEHLSNVKADQPQEYTDNTIIVVQREANPLNLRSEAVETIRRLLKPLYEDAQQLRSCFGPGMRDILEPATDLSYTPNYEDVILCGLADMVVRLGSLTSEKQQRWCFCWIMVPKDETQQLHTSSLVIRAQSKGALYKVKSSIAAPGNHTNNPYTKAMQSGHIIYLPRILTTDTSVTFRDLEKPVRSAIAIPLGGEDGQPIGVLYVASYIVNAFPEEDQRVLRTMGRMVEELLKTYRIRQQVNQKLTDMVKDPGLIDQFFEGFAPESHFFHDVETLLSTIQTQPEEHTREYAADKVISFIALDIDNQRSLASKYGDRLMRNLIREVGLRIQEQLRTSFKEYLDCQLYHIYADRFLILFKNTSLELAREHAERLRLGTTGLYKLDALRVFIDQYTRPESMIELPNISIRLGVTSYSFEKLKEILHEYPAEDAITAVRSIITSALDVALIKGQHEGGNVVISWNADIHSFVRSSPLP